MERHQHTHFHIRVSGDERDALRAFVRAALHLGLVISCRRTEGNVFRVRAEGTAASLAMLRRYGDYTDDVTVLPAVELSRTNPMVAAA